MKKQRRLYQNLEESDSDDDDGSYDDNWATHVTREKKKKIKYKIQSQVLKKEDLV